MSIVSPIVFEEIPQIDTWVPQDGDKIIDCMKNAVRMPVSKILNVESSFLDYFIMRPKKCYNSDDMREHICQVINYFEKYYDQEGELLLYISRIKYMIDMFPQYSKENFMHDIAIYILNESLKEKVVKLAEYNYTLNLTYRNISESLQYNNDHAKTMLEESVFMNFVIPLITHFAQAKRIGEIDEFILDIFDMILHMFPIDIFAKLYETSFSNVTKSEYKNPILWAKQDIRGKNTVTHSVDSVNNIILNIMPKYAFSKNIVALNYTSIQKNTSCQVLDIGYEYGFIPLSSSKRDSNDNFSSEMDKFEADMIRQNEAIYLQNKVNCEETVQTIDNIYGPFSDDEVNYFRDQLKNENGNVINQFQKQIIFALFYSRFGDPNAVKSIDNGKDYIRLMLAAKKILLDNHMVIMPYIISSKVEKLVVRNTVNKKEQLKLKQIQYYDMVTEKYHHNEKAMLQILSNVATVISSTFRCVDYFNKEIDGKIISIIPEMVMEEMLCLTLMI